MKQFFEKGGRGIHEDFLRNLFRNLSRAEDWPEPKRAEIALLSAFVFVHSVLKWLHHPPLQNVMLLHAAASSQDFLHAFSSDTCFDEAPRYIPPVLKWLHHRLL